MGFKGFCFDLDQTLCNSEDYMFVLASKNVNYQKTAEWQIYQFLKPHLKIVDWENFLKIYLQSRKEVSALIPHTASSHNRYLYIQKTLENFNMRFQPSLIYEASNIYWSYIIKRMRLFPSVRYVLEKIKEQHLPIAIVTDLTADIQNQKLLSLNIEKYIDLLITSEEAGVDKPHRKIMAVTLDKMQLNRDEVIMIGNNPKTDIQVAHNIGCKSILYDYNKKYVTKKDRNEPTFYINNFLDILKLTGIKKKSYSNRKLLVFDMIGTLTDNSHLVSTILKEKIPNKNVEIIKKHYEDYKINKINNTQFWEKLGFKGNFEDLENKVLQEIQLRPDVLPLLEELHKDYDLAILSNIPKEWGLFLSERYNFNKYFKEIVFSGVYKIKKPDAKIYRFLLDKFPNIKPGNVYFVDDELGDLSGGKKMLMQTIWLRSDKRVDNYIPDFVIKELSEVKEILKS